MRKEFKVSFFLNGTQLNISPSSYRFSLHDSIHQLFSDGEIVVTDINGIFKETATFTEGQEIDLTLTLNTESLYNKFVVVHQNSSGTMPAQGNMDDDLTAKLKNVYFKNQTAISRAYNDKISSIIRTFVQEYGGFKSYDLDTTTTKNIWYQPIVNNAEFIVKHLLPFAYSKSSGDTPFFCYINNDNRFNFKHYLSLLNEAPVDTIHIRPEIHLLDDKLEGSYAMITRFFSTGSNYHHKLRHRLNYQISNEDGSLVETKDYIDSYPNTSKNIPLVADKDFVTSYDTYYDDEDDIVRRELSKSLQINSMKNSLFLDRVFIRVKCNLLLTAGKKIKINAPHYKLNETTNNSYFNDEWIIEESTHYWTGTSAYTEIIAARKDTTLLRQYKMLVNLF